MLEIFGFEWVTWGYITAVFLLLVLLEVIIVRSVREGKEQTSKRWSLKRAAVYGLVFSLFMFGADVIFIWAGIRSPSPFMQGRYSPAGAVGYLIGWLGSGSILFVIVAAIRNAARGRSADEDESREWGGRPTKSSSG